jgi:hypothetical protein
MNSKLAQRKDKAGMRIFLLFFLYILGAYVLAALLSIPFGPIVAEASGAPIHKFVSRGGLLIALLGFWPFLTFLRLDNKPSLGFALPRARFIRCLGKAYLLGVLILSALAAALVLLDIRLITEPDAWRWAKALLQGLLSGLAVGFIEESFFRGAMFSAIRQRNGVLAAILLPSLLYAALHFLKPQPFAMDQELGLWVALNSVSGGFAHLFQWQHLDSFFALFMVGVFLALVRWRSGHIAWCIGLHAGWVSIIKLTRSASDTDRSADYAYLVGHYDGMIGWLAAAWIGLLALAFWTISAWWAKKATSIKH